MRPKAFFTRALSPLDRFERLAGGVDWERWTAAARAILPAGHQALADIDKAIETGADEDRRYALFAIMQTCIHDPRLALRFARRCRKENPCHRLELSSLAF
jgi:hypothetical protein